MGNMKIVNTLSKRHKKPNFDKYKINKKWDVVGVNKNYLSSNVIAGVTKKKAKITELPINGYLTIDDQPLSINQIILLNDVSRLKFTIHENIQKSDYGNFKFIVFQGTVTEEEFYFSLDANIINNNHYTNDNHETISLQPANKAEEVKSSNDFKLKNEKLEKELLEFIAKRESGIVYDTKADSWVEATKSIFEEETFDTENVKNEVR